MEFTPIVYPTQTGASENPPLIVDNLSHMERRRGWFPANGKNGLAGDLGGKKDQLGPDAANAIEALLALGGTIVELGAGELNASKDLANAYPQGRVIAIEPYPNPDTLQNLPANLQVIAKPVEALTTADLPDNSIDGGFSAFVLMYPQDKLAFLKQAYRILRPDGHALIQYFGAPTYPSIPDIFQQFGYQDKITMHRLPVGVLLDFHKNSATSLDFGTYSTTFHPLTGATVATEYHFK